MSKYAPGVINTLNFGELSDNDFINFVNEDCAPETKMPTTEQQNPMHTDLKCTSPNHYFSRLAKC